MIVRLFDKNGVELESGDIVRTDDGRIHSLGESHEIKFEDCELIAKHRTDYDD